MRITLSCSPGHLFRGAAALRLLAASRVCSLPLDHKILTLVKYARMMLRFPPEAKVGCMEGAQISTKWSIDNF
jgi:hypothetical protein